MSDVTSGGGYGAAPRPPSSVGKAVSSVGRAPAGPSSVGSAISSAHAVVQHAIAQASHSVAQHSVGNAIASVTPSRPSPGVGHAISGAGRVLPAAPFGQTPDPYGGVLGALMRNNGVQMPKGGPLANILPEQQSLPSSVTGPQSGLPSFENIVPQLQPRSTTTAPLSRDMRTLIDTIKAESVSGKYSVPKPVRDQLTKAGYLGYQESPGHKLLGVGQSGFVSGPNDPQGMAQDQKYQASHPQTGGFLPEFGHGSGVSGYLGRVANDVTNTTASIVPGAVQLGSGVVQAAQGNTAPLVQQGANLVDFATHPKQWAEHPFMAGTMFGGAAIGAVGRAGAAGRAATAGGRAAGEAGVLGRFLDTSRAPLSAGGIPVPRSYHENPLFSAAQKTGEAIQRRVGVDPNVALSSSARARRALIGGGPVASLIERHTGVPLAAHVKPGSFDLHAAGWEMMRRQAGVDASRMAQDIHPGGHGVQASRELPKGSGQNPQLVRLFAQGSIQPGHEVASLEAKLGAYRAAEPKLKGEDLAVNRINQQNILAALNSPKLNIPGLWDAANKYAAYHNASDVHAVQLGRLTQAQAEHGQWSRYAMDQMGARVMSGDKHPSYQALQSIKSEITKIGTKNVTPALKARLVALQADVHALRAAHVIKADGTRYPRLVDQAGKELPIATVRGHAAEHSPGLTPAYINERPAALGTRFAAQSGQGRRPGVAKKTRTGTAEGMGITNHSFDALHAQLFNSLQHNVGHARENATKGRFALGNYSGRTVAEATQKALADAGKFKASADGHLLTGHERGLGPLVPVTFGPNGVVKAIDPHMASAEHLHQLESLPVDERAWHEGGQARVSLMHQALLDRQGEWSAIGGTRLARTAQKVTGGFRGAALFTSPRWPVGSMQERLIRLILGGVAPANIAGVGRASKAGKVVESELHKTASGSAADRATWEAKHLSDVIHAGGLLGSQMFTDVRRIATDPRQGEILKDPANMLLSERPGARQIVKGWRGWKQQVTRAIAAVEHNANRALVGKQALKGQRDLGQARSLLNRLMGTVNQSEAYLREWARTGVADPVKAEQILRNHLEIAGNWTHQPPTIRTLTQSVSPFGLWWLNSVKLLAKSLPRDHPLALMASSALASSIGDEGRKQQQALPPWMQGDSPVNIPGVGPQMLDLQHYSPYDIARTPGETAMSMLAFGGTSELYDIARGINPLTHRELKPGQIPPAILDAILAGYFPGERIGAQVATGAGSLPARALHVVSPLKLSNPPGAPKSKGSSNPFTQNPGGSSPFSQSLGASTGVSGGASAGGGGVGGLLASIVSPIGSAAGALGSALGITPASASAATPPKTVPLTQLPLAGTQGGNARAHALALSAQSKKQANAAAVKLGAPSGTQSLITGPAQFAGVDQGIDFTGKGIVHALGDGVVTRVVPTGSGWPGQGALISYKLTSGPQKGQYIYAAEDLNIASGLKPGSVLKQGQPIGVATGSGQAPGIEVGFADASGRAIAHAPSSGPQPAGNAFNAFVRGQPVPSGGNFQVASSGVPAGSSANQQLQKLWIKAGGNKAAAPMAAAIALAESSGNTHSNLVTSKEDSRGLWQVNTFAHPGLGNLYDPLTNAKAAVAISNNGTNWGPWSTYGNGAYQQYLNGGGPSSVTSSGGGSVGSSGGSSGGSVAPSTGTGDTTASKTAQPTDPATGLPLTPQQQTMQLLAQLAPLLKGKSAFDFSPKVKGLGSPTSSLKAAGLGGLPVLPSQAKSPKLSLLPSTKRKF